MSSLRDKLALSAVVLLAVFMGSLLAANALLLEWYYVLRTKAPFLRVYEQVRAAGPLPADPMSGLVRRLGAESGYKLVIAGRDGLLRFSSAPEFRQGARQELPREQKEYFLQLRNRLEQGQVLYGALDQSSRGQPVVQLMAQVDAGLFLIVSQPLQQLRTNVRIAASFFLIVGLGLLLRESIDRFAAQAAEKKVRIDNDLPEGLRIRAEGQRIGQVLDNLLSNALRHTPPGGLIRFRARTDDDALRVEILNTGQPIAAEHLPHLFEPFYRVEDDRSREAGGSGLGLSIVQGIIAAHGGRCGVRNEAGGVLFWFSLPAGGQAG